MSFKVMKRKEKERARNELRVVKMLMILDPRWVGASAAVKCWTLTLEQQQPASCMVVPPTTATLARLFCTLLPPPLVIFTASNPSAELVRLRG